MSDELVARLRALADNGCQPGMACEQCQARFDAADRLAAQVEEIERLREDRVDLVRGSHEAAERERLLRELLRDAAPFVVTCANDYDNPRAEEVILRLRAEVEVCE